MVATGSWTAAKSLPKVLGSCNIQISPRSDLYYSPLWDTLLYFWYCWWLHLESPNIYWSNSRGKISIKPEQQQHQLGRWHTHISVYIWYPLHVNQDRPCHQSEVGRFVSTENGQTLQDQTVTSYWIMKNIAIENHHYYHHYYGNIISNYPLVN